MKCNCHKLKWSGECPPDFGWKPQNYDLWQGELVRQYFRGMKPSPSTPVILADPINNYPEWYFPLASGDYRLEIEHRFKQSSKPL